MENRFKFKKCLIALLIILLALITFNIFVSVSMSVYADTPNSTNVLADLQKDPNFKVSDYLDKADDYSIQVIQIAESTAKELLIYTYQPCQRTCYLLATCVNMSLSEDVQGTKLYDLEFLSCEGVFCKYKVKDVVVADNEYRYYNITSIYRAWNEDLDDPSGNDNIFNEVAFEVGKLYKASTVDGKVTYTHEFVETIEIVNPYVDFLRYSNGFWLASGACDSHYIAFDTNKQIDKLMEASISYEYRTAHSQVGMNEGTSYGPIQKPEPKKIIVTDKGQTIDYGNPWFTKKFEWDRIQSVEKFKETENLKPETEKNLEGTKWVLRFYETSFNTFWDGMGGYTDYIEVTNVTILRLKFITNGRLYDLGAVSNKITGDNIPGGGEKDTFDPFRWLKDLVEKLGIPVWALILIIVLIFLAILLPVLGLIFPVVGQALKVIFKAIGKLIKWLFNALVWIISLPIKGIVWIVNKCKGGGTA